uniref:Uncharacterized protein n=1 Tax=viral metagenome TaxID=1070528 RepID=A0A6C0EV82_9ZZZZ
MICENVNRIYSSTPNIDNKDSIINYNSFRKDNYRSDRFPITENNKESHTNVNDTSNININIYRYKFTDDFIAELYKFSKIHQYDERKDFKEAWNIWIEEEAEIVDIEIRRLMNIGYEGNILDKMFKSARYYFRKKSTEKKAPKIRRSYVPVRKELLDCMDKHIISNINNDDYKPSEGFASFCKDYIELLKEEISILCKNGFNNSQEIKNKFKKTYKNRYFILTNK